MEQQTKKYILWGLGIVALGTGGYFLYKHLKGNSETIDKDDLKEELEQSASNLPALPPPIDAPPRKKVPPKKTAPKVGFPLQFKSTGRLVLDIQNALIKKYGSQILPKHGADGVFDSETITALMSKGYPTIIDSDMYGRIMTGKPATGDKITDKKGIFPSGDVSKYLHKAIKENSIFYALDALKKMTSVANYIDTNEQFKQVFIQSPKGTARKTIVNALFDQFTAADYRKKITERLKKIGLKYNGSKWSLSGLDDMQIITISPTQVWNNQGQRMDVPNGTVLGDFVSAFQGTTLFLTPDGRKLFVSTQHIAYA